MRERRIAIGVWTGVRLKYFIKHTGFITWTTVSIKLFFIILPSTDSSGSKHKTIASVEKKYKYENLDTFIGAYFY